MEIMEVECEGRKEGREGGRERGREVVCGK